MHNPDNKICYVVDGMTPESVVVPRTFEETAGELGAMSRANLSVIPWGGGTRMKVGNVPRRYDAALDTRELSEGMEHIAADMVCIVPAGMSFGKALSELALEGQRFPFVAPAESTLGGALASNMPGDLRGKFGGIRDSVIGMKVATTNGKIVKSGGRVVKNVQGFDMHRLHTGAFGALGVIVEAAFKLIPMPESQVVVVIKFDNADNAWETASILYEKSFTPEVLKVFESTEAERTIVSVCLAGSDATVSAMAEDIYKVAHSCSADASNTMKVVPGDTLGNVAGKPSSKPDVTVRASLLPNSMSRYVADIKRFLSGNDGVTLSACSDALFGSVLLKLYCDSDAVHRSFIHKCFESATALRGNAVIEDCPLYLKQETDIFGEPPSSIGLMQNLKKRFDPMSILNDGRFIGRI